MTPFTFYNPTRLVFGRGRIAELPSLLPEGAKVLLTFGGGSVKRNGIYDQVFAALKAFDTVEFWGIEANPKVETLEKAIQLGRDEGVTFVLSVGGGSVLDGSKLIACALADDAKKPAWDLVLERRPKTSIDYGSVMTLPATGSEMNDNSVISRLETDEKLSFVTPKFPLFSILDPDAVKTLPKHQIAASLADITAHTLEQYMTYPGQSRSMDRWAEGLLSVVREVAPVMLADSPAPDDVVDDYMLSATLALNDMIAMGVVQDWATHAIGHEITAFTGTAHGASLAMVYPALLRARFAQKQAKLTQMGRRVFALQGDDETVAHEAINALEALFASMGLATRLEEAGIDEAVDAAIVERFKARGWKLGERRDITHEEVAEILAIARPRKA